MSTIRNVLESAKLTLEEKPVYQSRVLDKETLDFLADPENANEALEEVFGEEPMVLSVITNDQIVEIKKSRVASSAAHKASTKAA